MDVLWWLAPPVVVTVVAMVAVAVVGRDRADHDRSEAAQERARARFAEAIARDLPQAARGARGSTRARPSADHSTGIAVRRRTSA